MRLLLARLGLDDRDLSYGLIVDPDMGHGRPRLIGKRIALSSLSVEGPTLAIVHLIDLARHDEIVSSARREPGAAPYLAFFGPAKTLTLSEFSGGHLIKIADGRSL
jgi:hypothetical protein